MDESDLQGALAAYFLIPLPEPLGIPERSQLRQTRAEDFGDFLKRSAGEPSGFDRGPGIEDFVSLVAHHVRATSVDAYGLSDLLALAHRVLPWAKPDDSVRSRLRTLKSRLRRWSQARTTGRGPVQDVTVIEALVLLVGEPGMETLSEALDRGLAFVRDIQRAYGMVRRHPITLVSRESLPFAIPYAVGRLQAGMCEPVTTLSLFMLNQNLWAFTREPDLNSDEMELLSKGMKQIRLNRPFLTGLECQREARVALTRRGEYRTAAILAATAAEATLDDLLLHLMWEEGATPEAAADVFADPRRGLLARVKAEYASRIGGTWDVERSGAIRDWAQRVSSLRHRAVHAPILQLRLRLPMLWVAWRGSVLIWPTA